MAYYNQLPFTYMQVGINKHEFSVTANSRADSIRKRFPIPIFVFMLSVLAVLSCTKQPPRELNEGLAFYRQNQLEEALPLLERAVEQDKENPEAYAWLAETYRRLLQIDKAISAARKAIEINPCYSFAHTVMADAYNPMYGSWEGANFDTTWKHLLRAVACDSGDGNAWLSIWSEAIRRGEHNQIRKALRSMVETGFLTPAVLSYNRWMLRYLPENALLLTNGDMDTYPAVALQEVEHFRTDVAVVNQSLLNTSWYARFIRDQYGIPLPFRDTELDSLRPYRDENENLIWVSKQILRGWLNQQKRGAFLRPIAISVTVNQSFISEIEDHLKPMGAFWLWFPEPVDSPPDTTMMRVSLASINPDDFAGSFVSPQDRSPVRRTYSNGMVRNVTSTALHYSNILIKSERFSEANKILTWAEEFEKKTELGPVFTDQIAKLKEAALREMK
ncbi:tetratricopeptide repeat protein [candidate division KSB1 bacterium]|nr:tetratricopeptide repeat protein [candidate division KSB1 bacterium]